MGPKVALVFGNTFLEAAGSFSIVRKVAAIARDFVYQTIVTFVLDLAWSGYELVNLLPDISTTLHLTSYLSTHTYHTYPHIVSTHVSTHTTRIPVLLTNLEIISDYYMAPV